jgi:hypothetical protein
MTPSDHSGYILQITGGSQSFIAIGNDTTGTGALNGLILGNDSTGADIYQRENQPLRLHTNNTERMRINSSGNVGIGTTSPGRTLDVNGIIRSDGTSGALAFGGNSSTPSEGVAIHRPASDTMAFVTGSTERMRIDSAGLVSMTHAAGAHTGGLSIINSQAGGYGSSLTFQSERSDDNSIVSAAQIRTQGQDSWNSAASADSNLFFATALNGSLTDKMVIKHDGAVGIGETSPLGKLHIKGTDVGASPASTANQLVLEDTENGISILSNTAGAGNINFGDSDDNGKGGFIYDHSADAMRHIVNGGEHMRIDSSGNLLVGKTSSSPSSQTGSVNYGDGFFALTLTNSRADTLNVYNTSASAYRFYLTSAGQIHATSTSITAISDERLKENIVDLETGLSEVMSLQPRRFDWKNGDGENVAGFIAQEVETVLPDLISDYKHENLDDAKSVRMGDMIPTLVKAIQEQQEQIDELKAKLEDK